MIVQTINLHQFREAFANMNRNDNFSYEGQEVLFEYLDNHSEETGDAYELDVIALCCEFAELDWQDAANEYRIDLSDCADDEERAEAVLDYLNDHTLVCGETSTGAIVFQQF